MAKPSPKNAPLRPWQLKLHEVIFEADTPAGKRFDIALLICIVLSVLAVLLDSVKSIHDPYETELYIVEWIFTIIFTIEYMLRLICVSRPLRYARSFFGIVDLISILPTYISLVVVGSQYLIVIRALRLLRIFRVLKLVQFVGEANVLQLAIKNSIRKIVIFVGTVLVVVLIVGSLMHLIEGPKNGFTSIPQSMYWAIVTMTTVGYGDIAPQTITGKFLASILMLTGYGIIAVPTGIVTVELASAKSKKISTQACPSCSEDGHDPDARFCKFCGTKL